MAEPRDPNKPEEFDADAIGRPYGEEPPEVEESDLPRRAASARFIVDSEVGSEALLRDAMDPANQSLADALRLSFRVLQAVIVVLIVLFLASGLKTVDDGYSGVRTLWGRIVEPLSPGPKFSIYPYPAAEFVTFKAENRTVDLGEYFTIPSRGRTRERILEETDVGSSLSPGPGREGSLITGDGDLAHLELSVKYEIDQPIEFVHAVNDADQRRDADEIVKMALKRAAVHVAGSMPLQQFIDPSRVPEIKESIRLRAQATLDEVKSGIRLVDVTSLEGYAPYAIQKAMNAVQEALVEAGQAVINAKNQANQTLGDMVGGQHRQVLDLIDAYQRAVDAGEQQTADERLASIDAKLKSDEVTGQVSQIITQARSYQSQVESLGNEYRRFAGLLPAYREHPQLVIRQQWLEAMQQILSHSDTEVIYVPGELGTINIALAGSQDIQNVRQDERFKEAQQATINKSLARGGYVATGEAIFTDTAGRQLKRDPKTGRLVPVG